MKAQIISIKNHPTTFYVLLTGIVFAVAFYIYCVNRAVRNVVVRKQAESEISSLQTSVSELEYKYMSSENAITLEKAESIGLSEPTKKIFISRSPQNKLLSLYNNR